MTASSIAGLDLVHQATYVDRDVSRSSWAALAGVSIDVRYQNHLVPTELVALLRRGHRFCFAPMDEYGYVTLDVIVHVAPRVAMRKPWVTDGRKLRRGVDGCPT